MSWLKHAVYCFLVGWHSPLADLAREVRSGFCRHWYCNCDCDRKCAQCGVRCPEHDDEDHPFDENEP